MSARAPFVPGSRPASRAAHLQDQPEPTKKTFSPDPSNPLNANNGSGKLFPKLNLQQQTDNSNAKENKPLNTSSLIRKKNANAQSAGTPAQRSGSMRKSAGDVPPTKMAFQENNNRGSGEDRTQGRTPPILAPVPRQAAREESPLLMDPLANPMLTQNTQKAQKHGHMMKNVTQNEADIEKRTHTVNSSAHIPMSTQTPVQENQPMQLPSPPKSGRVQGTRLQAFERLQPGSGGKQPAARHSLDQSLLVPVPVMDDMPNPFESMMNMSMPNNFAVPAKRGRGHGGPDEYANMSMDGQGHPPAKRHRGQGSADAYNHHLSAAPAHPSSPLQDYYEPCNFQSSPQTHRDSLNQDGQGQQGRYSYRQDRPLTPRAPPSNQAQLQGQGHPGSSQASDQGHGEQLQFGGALERMLEFNVEEYVEQKAEEYEKSAARWRECTMEEWTAGAEEHAERWTKMLDFVKDYVNAKVQLYAGFKTKFQAHRDNSDVRDKTLAEVKEQMVENLKNNSFYAGGTV